MRIKADGSPIGLIDLINEIEYSDPHDMPEQAPELVYFVDFRDYNPRDYHQYKNAYVSIWCSFKGYEKLYKVGVSGKSIEPGHEKEELAKAKEQVAAWNADPEHSPKYAEAQEIWDNWRKSKINHYDYMSSHYKDIYQNKKYSGD